LVNFNGRSSKWKRMKEGMKCLVGWKREFTADWISRRVLFFGCVIAASSLVRLWKNDAVTLNLPRSFFLP
jgi:hypothetical protein